MPSCPKCHEEFQKEIGLRVHHTLVHGKRLPICVCRTCGVEFYSADRNMHCDECIETVEWRVIPDPPEGEDNPLWQGGKVEASCDYCGNLLNRWPSAVENQRVLCDSRCQSDWFSEAFTGEGHPNWAGGGNRDYGPGWRRTKLETLERDGYRCALCGTSRDDLGRIPDVHHIIPVRLFDESPDHDLVDAHFPENFIALA